MTVQVQIKEKLTEAYGLQENIEDNIDDAVRHGRYSELKVLVRSWETVQSQILVLKDLIEVFSPAEYTAYDNSGFSIITCPAKDPADAVIQIERQLDREGRREYYHKWRTGGRWIIGRQFGNVIVYNSRAGAKPIGESISVP